MITISPLERKPKALDSTPIFDFSEPTWSKFSSEISEFINQCLDEDVNRRPSASELLENSSLMQNYKLDNLDKHHFKEMIESDMEINSFKIHFLHLLNEIIHQKITINEAKLQAVRDIGPAFHAKKVISPKIGKQG